MSRCDMSMRVHFEDVRGNQGTMEEDFTLVEVNVEYIDGILEQVFLCSGCQSKFEDRDFVTGVSAADRLSANQVLVGK